MAYREDTNSTLIVTIGAVAGITLVVLAVGVQAWFLYEEADETDAKWKANVDYKMLALHEEQAQNLNGYRWVDKDKKIASMPIQNAMQQLIANNGKLPE